MNNNSHNVMNIHEKQNMKSRIWRADLLTPTRI